MQNATLNKRHSLGSPIATFQRGISLLFALIALAALSLAAVALVRSVDGGAALMGNLGFKQDATATSHQAAELAITWLSSQTGNTTLEADVEAQGYYATSLDALDATGSDTAAATRVAADWDGDNCASVVGTLTRCLRASTVLTVNGNNARYVITRLCAIAGATSAAGNSCAVPLSTTAAADSNRGGLDYTRPHGFSGASGGAYYRIVVRTAGARNTRSYTETIVHF